MNKLISRVLFAGVEKQEFEALKKDYIEQDRNGLFWYSLIVMVFFCVLGIYVSLKNEIFVENAIPYFGTSVAMALIMVCAWLLGKTDRKEAGVRFLVYFFMTAMYAEAAFVTIKHPDHPAVTFIGILLVLPLLFVDRPINVMLAQAVFSAAFCLLVVKFKNPAIVSTDIWDGITFLIASWAEILILIPMRIGSIQKTKKIEFLSKNDLLTGALNRNAYEERIGILSEKADETLVCIYADVNGLHEMNNSYGHGVGDRMLQTVSEELQNAFGYDEIYRIGGDEFVILSVNRDMDMVSELLTGIQKALRSENYYVSFGVSAVNDHDMDIQSTVKDAEHHMYDAKRQFYLDNGLDRRARK